ncbi:MAG: RidA family protein [Albidovulum sp.]|nr:RidA family protein [Albidovulum sp.]
MGESKLVRALNPRDVPHHKNPIPAAAIHRGMLVSSAISGADPESGNYSNSSKSQIEMAFRHFRSILAEGNADPQDVVKVDFFFQNIGDRPLVNEYWLELYPDGASRPARHAHISSQMPAGCLFQIQFMAIVER